MYAMRTAALDAKRSTSIRVSIPTRDSLSQAAADAGLSLTAYLDTVAQKSERDRVFSAFRENWQRATEDPAFRAEVQEWDDMQDDIWWV